MDARPTPPAYAIGFNPDDYNMSGYRYTEIAEGCCTMLNNQTDHNQTNEDHIMAAIKTKNAPAATASKVEKEVVEKKPSFSKQVVAMLLEGKSTDEEISEALAPEFPDLKDTSPGAVNYYRKLHNVKAAAAGEPEIEKKVRDAKGRLVNASEYTPTPAVEEKAAPVAKAATKAAAPVAAPAAKVAVKKK